MDAASDQTVSRQSLADALRAIGLGAGDVVQVHSSLSALGHVEGGPDTVVDALLDVLGPEGTLMVPTFNHASVDIFDPWHSPSTNGAITEAVRLRPQARRSRHPTHPYAAIGRLADWLTEGPALALTFGPDCPLGRLARVGGWILLLGVGVQATTAAHIGETMAGAPCIGELELPIQFLADDGEVRLARAVAWRDGKCPIEWTAFEEALRQRHLMRDGRAGSGELHLFRASDAIETSRQLARQLCAPCPTRKRIVRYRTADALGDWPGGATSPVVKAHDRPAPAPVKLD